MSKEIKEFFTYYNTVQDLEQSGKDPSQVIEEYGSKVMTYEEARGALDDLAATVGFSLEVARIENSMRVDVLSAYLSKLLPSKDLKDFNHELKELEEFIDENEKEDD